jgi:hypothetical protein
MKINPFCRYSADKNNKNLVFEKQASTVSQSAAVFHVQASAEISTVSLIHRLNVKTTERRMTEGRTTQISFEHLFGSNNDFRVRRSEMAVVLL